MIAYLDIPPVERRGWPGQHAVSLDHFGGKGKWQVIRITGTGDSYMLELSPQQLIGIALRMCIHRTRRASTSFVRNCVYAVKQALPE
jgi:hypothetical protein